jgi:hypothetical protein
MLSCALRGLYKAPLPTDPWFPPWKQSELCSALLCAVCIVKLTTFMTHGEGTFLRRNLLIAFLIGNVVVGVVLALKKLNISAAVFFIEGVAFLADILRPREVKAAGAKAEKPATPRAKVAASPKPAAKKRPGSPTPAKQDKSE